MKKTLALAALCCLPPYAWSSTPPRLPQQLPPLAIPREPHPLPARPHTPPVKMTRELIESSNMSSTKKIDLLAHLGSASATTVERRRTAVPSVAAVPDAASHRYRTLATPLGTSRAVNDSNQDIEPAVITGRFGGVDRTTTAFTKFLPGTIPQHYWTSTTDFVNFDGAPSGWQMPLPPGTTRSSDPYLSENPFSNAPFPNRTYCAGTAYDIVNGQFGYNALVVWYSDYPAGPNAWTPIVVDADSNPIFFDKPSIVTSWHPATRGYTYLATMVLHNDNPSSADIQIYRQTTTQGFTLVNRMLYLPGGVTSPIITVDNNTGDVYLLYLDKTYNAIQIARSTDMGNTFSAPISFTATAPVTSDERYGKICDANGANCVRAASVIMARANSADNSIGVAWHLFEVDGKHTDCGFNQFQLGTQSWHWWRGIQIGHPGANDGRDQWNPALDPASDGSYLMTWYDKRNDPSFFANGNSYQVFGVRTYADGTPIDSVDSVLYDSSTAANLTLLPVAGSYGLRYMGEYQDVWEWYGTWYGATTYIDGSGSQDVYLTRTSQ